MSTGKGYSLRFKTLVFMDLESTSVPPEELPKNVNITEMTFVSIHIDRFNEKLRPPRVLNKLTLCIQPKSLVSHTAMEMTGLFNGNLECQQKFSSSTGLLLKHFLGQLEAPVCLLAHNGANFDFRLLKAELYATEVSLPHHIYCSDTLTACKYLIGANLQSKYVDDEYESYDEENPEIQNNAPSSSRFNGINENYVENATSQNGMPEIKEPVKEIDGFGPQTQAEVFKSIAEALDNRFTAAAVQVSPKRRCPHLTPPPTPRKIKKKLRFGTVKKRRIIDFGPDEKQFYPKNIQGLTLSNVYRKVVGEDMKSAHESEADCLNLLKVCHKLDGFVEFCEYNARPFADDFWIKPMWFAK